MSKLTPLEAAKTLCQKSDWSISNLRLNKLIYMAHMASLGKFDKPLVDEEFEAWTYGPVLSTLYHKAKIFGSESVKNIFHSTRDIEYSAEVKLLTSIYNQIGSLSGGELIALTHRDGGAWYKHYEPGQNAVIPNDSITKEFSALFHDQ